MSKLFSLIFSKINLKCTTIDLYFASEKPELLPVVSFIERYNISGHFSVI